MNICIIGFSFTCRPCSILIWCFYQPEGKTQSARGCYSFVNISMQHIVNAGRVECDLFKNTQIGEIQFLSLCITVYTTMWRSVLTALWKCCMIVRHIYRYNKYHIKMASHLHKHICDCRFESQSLRGRFAHYLLIAYTSTQFG